MAIENTNSLEYIRHSRGPGALRQAFLSLAARDKERAARLLDDTGLTFPTLFILIPDLQALHLCGALGARNTAALALCAQKTENTALAACLPPGPLSRGEETRKALRWTFLTGSVWEGPGEGADAYDTVLDGAAALLLCEYRDRSILPDAARLIFMRNRRGCRIHDLVWAFFRSGDPGAAEYLARGLLSDWPEDGELACALLRLPLPDSSTGHRGRQALYRNYSVWLKKNRPFLYLTGESLQMSSQPEPLRLAADSVLSRGEARHD